MSDDTPILSLPLIQPAQAQKHVTHNEALRLLDITVQLAVLDDDRNTPPALPEEGDRHIIGPAPGGEWQGRAGQIAAWWGGAWAYVQPGQGWQARLLSQSITLTYASGQWSPAFPLPETLPRLGIATTADATNRLSVMAPATLLTHDGAGHQLKINKAAPADTASLLFQTAWSGRAEMGLTGSDAFAIRTSANGTAFATALSVDPGTATLSAPNGLAAPLSLRDPADPTKRATIDMTTLPTGADCTYTLPDISSEIATLGGTQTFTGTKTFSGTFTTSGTTATLGSSAANATYGVGTGATANGNSKTVNLGTGGATGSTTTVNLGPTNPGATGTVALHGGTVTLGATVTDFDMGSASARGVVLGLGGATGDATNRLAVNAPGVLFNHAGSSIEATLNKAHSAANAFLAFKTAFSTRAQFGLFGTDDLSLRLSADGSAFTTALSVDPATARTSFAQPIALQGLPTDPAMPADGTLWHNSTTAQIGARLGGHTLRLDGQQEMPWLTPPAGDWLPSTTGSSGGATTNPAAAANRMDIFPFMPRADISIDRLAVNCTTAVPGALARIVVYATDALGRPSILLHDSDDLDLSGTGVKQSTVTMTLQQGRTLWLGIRHSANPNLSAWNLAGTPDINGGTTPATGARKVLRRSLAWSEPTPTDWGFVSSEITQAPATAIWLRMA